MDPGININQFKFDCFSELTKKKAQLPKDLVLEILKEILPRFFISSMSSICQDLSLKITPDIWRKVVSECFAFGAKEYKTLFDHDVENIELPLDIHRKIMDLFKFSVDNDVNQPPILVLIDPRLTLKKIGEFVKPYFEGTKNGYGYIAPELITDSVNEPDSALIKKPYWVLLMNGVIGRSKNYGDQKTLLDAVKKDDVSIYQIPTAEEAVMGLYLKQIVSKKCEFKAVTYTRTQNMLNGYKVCVGDITPVGLTVSTFCYDFSSFGVSAMRKL